MAEGLFPAVEPRLRDGRLDFYMGPQPVRVLSNSYRVELLFRNERLVVWRRNHPLRHARSIAELLDAEWIVTGLRERVEEEFEEQFTALGMRVPRPAIVALPSPPLSAADPEINPEGTKQSYLQNASGTPSAYCASKPPAPLMPPVVYCCC